MSERYSFSLTTFNPSGKLVQIEYALKAVDSGAPSVGIRATNGVVLAVERKFSSVLVDEASVHRVEMVAPRIGMLYSGLSPDFRVLVQHARRLAQRYHMLYRTDMPVEQLVAGVAAVMQEYTQSGGVRPFGVSLLVAGWDDVAGQPMLYQCDPSGTYFAWKATALGRNNTSGKTFLEKRWTAALELEDAVHTAILALKESFEGQINENNVELGVCDAKGFRRLTPAEVKDYLAFMA